MQNRYFGDIGDFSKYGMLRQVLEAELRLGINWYLYPNEKHNQDGKHRQYLTEDKHKVSLCDDDLYKFLFEQKNKEKSISLIEKSDKLHNTIFFNDYIHTDDYRIRLNHRQKWFMNSIVKLSGCDIIFCDPDNGFETQKLGYKEKRSGKYIFYNEAKRFYDLGKSLIVYHHGLLWYTEEQPLKLYVNEIKDNIIKRVSVDAIIICLRWETTAKRFYFWIIRPEHKDKLLVCVDKIINSQWGKHFSLIKSLSGTCLIDPQKTDY